MLLKCCCILLHTLLHGTKMLLHVAEMLLHYVAYDAACY